MQADSHEHPYLHESKKGLSRDINQYYDVFYYHYNRLSGQPDLQASLLEGFMKSLKADREKRLANRSVP